MNKTKDKIKDRIKDKTSILLFLACLAVSTLIFAYYGNGKTVWFCDEMYSYTIANSGSFGMNLAEQCWCSGTDIANTFFVAKDGFEYQKAIECTTDDNHPPVYYLLLHTASVFAGRYSKWIGYLVNWPFFLACLAMLYWSVYHLTKKASIAFLGVILFTFNGGILSVALLIRMYMLMIFLLFLFLYQLYQLYKDKDKAIFYIGMILCNVLGFLSNYCYVIYIVYISIPFLIYLLRKKRWKIIWKYIASMLGSAGLCIAVFPACVEQIFVGNKGTGAIHKAMDSKSLLKNAVDAFRIQHELLFSRFYLLGIVLAVAITVLFFRKMWKVKERRTLVFFVISNIFAVLAYMVTARQAFLSENRYLYPSMMIEFFMLLLMAMTCFSSGRESMEKKGMGCTFGLGAIFLILAVCINVPEPQIEYFGTKETKQQWEELEKERETPWIYYGPFDWMSMYCALDFTIPNRLYYVKNDSAFLYDETLDKENRFLVYMNQNESQIENLVNYMKQSVGGNYTYQKKYDRLNLVVYEIQKKRE